MRTWEDVKDMMEECVQEIVYSERTAILRIIEAEARCPCEPAHCTCAAPTLLRIAQQIRERGER